MQDFAQRPRVPTTLSYVGTAVVGTIAFLGARHVHHVAPVERPYDRLAVLEASRTERTDWLVTRVRCVFHAAYSMRHTDRVGNSKPLTEIDVATGRHKESGVKRRGSVVRERASGAWLLIPTEPAQIGVAARRYPGFAPSVKPKGIYKRIIRRMDLQPDMAEDVGPLGGGR